MNIQQEIQKVIVENNIIPLFYAESGSRLWRIASVNSDFDVRGVHLIIKDQAFSFRKKRDVIEKMEGDFDFVSFSLDKMFTLLVKSNPTVLEWIRSDIVYFNQFPKWEEFQKVLLENINFGALFYHYVSLALKNFELMENGKKLTYKSALYCIRGLLSAKISLQNILPSLLIDELLEQFDPQDQLLQIAKLCLERKKNLSETNEIEPKERTIILPTLKENIENLRLKKIDISHHQNVLEAYLEKVCIDLKKMYYS